MERAQSGVFELIEKIEKRSILKASPMVAEIYGKELQLRFIVTGFKAKKPMAKHQKTHELWIEASLLLRFFALLPGKLNSRLTNTIKIGKFFDHFVLRIRLVIPPPFTDDLPPVDLVWSSKSV